MIWQPRESFIQGSWVALKVVHLIPESISTCLATRLRNKGIQFVVGPYVHFARQAGEQATLFFLDPAGNALEFKAFRHAGQIFEKQT